MSGLYHQDERDDAAGYGLLAIVIMLAFVSVAAVVSLVLSIVDIIGG